MCIFLNRPQRTQREAQKPVRPLRLCGENMLLILAKHLSCTKHLNRGVHMKKSSSSQKIMIMLSLCVLCVLLRFLFMRGFHVIADDARYSKAAYEISQGQFNLPTNHHDARIGHTFAISLFYRLFGVNVYSATGSSIFFSIGNIFLILWLSREVFGEDDSFNIGAIGALLFVFVPISIEMGSSVLFHQGQAFFMYASLYWLLRGERVQRLYHYGISGVCIGIAYLFHEAGIFIFLVMIVYFFVKKTSPKKVVLIMLGAFMVLACENAIYYFEAGELLYRQRIALKTHFKIETIEHVTDLMIVKKTFNTITNPFSGTFVGDSWMLEPFRQLLLNPAHSVIYHLFFLTTILLGIKKDKRLLYLSVFFWPLFLYLSYGSPNPLSYKPLRRLPRYILPCLIPVCLTVSYGINRVLKQKYARLLVLTGFVAISLFCISTKGGDIGQRLHQCTYFSQFINTIPDAQVVTDSTTLMGLEFLAKYQPLDNIHSIDFQKFIASIHNQTFSDTNQGAYLFMNIPEIYEEPSVNLAPEEYVLLDQHERKPRKICYLPGMKFMLEYSLCDFSNGGKVYQIRKQL